MVLCLDPPENGKHERVVGDAILHDDFVHEPVARHPGVVLPNLHPLDLAHPLQPLDLVGGHVESIQAASLEVVFEEVVQRDGR